MVSEIFVTDKVVIGKDRPIVLIGGPCVIESEKICFEIAEKLIELTDKYNINYIFKASYDKGNRGKESSFRGPMIEEGLKLLKKIKEKYNIPILTDCHTESEIRMASDIVDIIQIPAYLSMQTSLTVTAANTGKTINIKKGQFLSPTAVNDIGLKVKNKGNERIMFTERGTTFGYNDLVCDYRNLSIMRNLGYPVIFDTTHIIRKPGISSSLPEGGNPEHILNLSRAAVASGIDGLFIETHPDPENALCDACSMLPLKYMERLIKECTEIDNIVKKYDLLPLEKANNGFIK